MIKKMIARILMVALVLVMEPSWAQDVISPARDLLNQAFGQLKSGNGWGSDEFGASLKKILTDYPNSPEAKTAGTLFVPFLMQKGNYNDALNVANVVIQDQPNSWQGSFAMLNKVAILQSQGNKQGSLQTALQALPAIDAAGLKTLKDPDFVSFTQAAGIPPSGIKDGVLGLTANQFIQDGNAQSAIPFIGMVQDPKMKAALAQNVPGGAAAIAAATPPSSVATAISGVTGGTTTAFGVTGTGAAPTGGGGASK